MKEKIAKISLINATKCLKLYGANTCFVLILRYALHCALHSAMKQCIFAFCFKMRDLQNLNRKPFFVFGNL